MIRCILDYAQRHLVDFWKKRPANFDFIWLEWSSYNSSIQFHIVWSRPSIFKLKCSLDRGWTLICSLGIFTHSTSLPLQSEEFDFKLGINKETSLGNREKILSMPAGKDLKNKIFSMTTSKVLKHVTKEIAKKSCKLQGFRISCDNMDHGPRNKNRIPKESRKSNEQVCQRLSLKISI